eukprot:TRINITY_DN11531_c1_g2_i1.p1 TRINITY_DN11531_c1_g2~~TRINITY_DN11531_c1_g2_i1.p1  ORF type:complete len:271 (+),score=65.32 TRINITY_DN11531_c1_g2_i1:741-1553(+)
MRSKRPVVAADTAQTLLQDEKRDAIKLKTAIESLHRDNIQLLQRMKLGRQELSRLVVKEKQPIALHDEAISGVVETYQRPQGAPPQPVKMAQELIHAARNAIDITAADMQSARDSLTQQHQAVTQALAEAVSDAKSHRATTTITRGEVQLVRQKTDRAIHLTQMRRSLNDGPTEGRFETVANRSSRPIVSQFNRREGQSSKQTTAWERSQSASQSLTRKTAQLTKQDNQLGMCLQDFSLSLPPPPARHIHTSTPPPPPRHIHTSMRHAHV